MNFTNQDGYNIVFVPTYSLRQSENINISHVNDLTCKVLKEGRWKTILPIEKTTKSIMDGNHRYNVALSLGINYLPVIELDYSDDRVSVELYSNNVTYNISLLLSDYRNKILLPYKTTKHQFIPLLPKLDIPINLLM